MGRLLGTLLKGVAAAAAAWGLWRFVKARDGASPPTAAPAPPSEAFFGWPPDVQRAAMTAWIRDDVTLGPLLEAAAASGRMGLVCERWVDLLGRHDPGMAKLTSDTVTRFGPDGKLGETSSVNQRVDDTLFKESLLYFVREYVEADSPLVERIVAAYDREHDPWTRMRVVRAVGKIGGERARAFARLVVEREGPDNTCAAQEARKYV